MTQNDEDKELRDKARRRAELLDALKNRRRNALNAAAALLASTEEHQPPPLFIVDEVAHYLRHDDEKTRIAHLIELEIDNAINIVLEGNTPGDPVALVRDIIAILDGERPGWWFKK